MKRRLLIVFLSSLLAVAAVAVVRWWPRLFPSGEVSELYRHYEHSEHIRASFIKGFPVDDTLRVDVTLLQSTDSAGWEVLKKDFNIKEFPSHVTDPIDSGKDIVSVKLTSKDHPGQPMDTSDILNNNVMAISRLRHTISLFEVHTEAEIDAVAHSKYRYSYKQ